MPYFMHTDILGNRSRGNAVAKLGGLGWGLKIYISIKAPGDASGNSEASILLLLNSSKELGNNNVTVAQPKSCKKVCV